MVSLSTLNSLTSGKALGNASVSAAASIQRLSTGNRITQAADDVAGLAVGTALQTQVNTLRSAAGNVSQGSSLLQVADGGISQQIDIAMRQQQLAMQASSGALNDANRAALNQEFQALSAELNRISATTNFNGVQLLNGSANGSGSLNFAVGTDSADQVNIALSDTSTSTIFGGQSTNISSQTSATAATTTLGNAITSLVSARANVGSLQSRFETAQRAIDSTIQNTDLARAGLLDTDIAVESTALAKARLQQQYSITTQAQTNKLSGNLLKLLD